MQILDCHAHICPDSIAPKNRDFIQRASGIVPASDGSVSHLVQMMKQAQVSKTVASNVVVRPDLMKKANEFTASAVRNNSNFLLGMAWIVPGLPESPEEVQRCRKELQFVGAKIHNSHFRCLPDDRRNDTIYENLASLDLPVLFHCGENPYAETGSLQYSSPSNFVSVVKSFPDLKIILGHLAGLNEQNMDLVSELLNASRNIYADTAVEASKIQAYGLRKLVSLVGAEKFVFGSDYPILDSKGILGALRNLLSEGEMRVICEENPIRLFPEAGENSQGIS